MPSVIRSSPTLTTFCTDGVCRDFRLLAKSLSAAVRLANQRDVSDRSRWEL